MNPRLAAESLSQKSTKSKLVGENHKMGLAWPLLALIIFRKLNNAGERVGFVDGEYAPFRMRNG